MQTLSSETITVLFFYAILKQRKESEVNEENGRY